MSAWTVLAPVLLPAPSWADPVETNLTETSVTLHWLAVPAAQQYILDAINLSTGLSIGTGWIAPAGVTELLITGLTPATGYAFHLSYQTATGQNSEQATAQLYTLTPVVSAVTEPATNVSANSATLNGTVQSEGAIARYYFEYGLTTAYGARAGSNTVLSPWPGKPGLAASLGPAASYDISFPPRSLEREGHSHRTRRDIHHIRGHPEVRDRLHFAGPGGPRII